MRTRRATLLYTNPSFGEAERDVRLYTHSLASLWLNGLEMTDERKREKQEKGEMELMAVGRGFSRRRCRFTHRPLHRLCKWMKIWRKMVRKKEQRMEEEAVAQG